MTTNTKEYMKNYMKEYRKTDKSREIERRREQKPKRKRYMKNYLRNYRKQVKENKTQMFRALKKAHGTPAFDNLIEQYLDYNHVYLAHSDESIIIALICDIFDVLEGEE